MEAVLLFVAGGVWRRWFGGWGGYCPRAAKLAVAALALGGYFLYQTGDSAASAALGAAWAAMWVSGHGSYMDMGRGKPDNEFLAPLLRWLKDGTEIYDIVGMVSAW